MDQYDAVPDELRERERIIPQWADDIAAHIVKSFGFDKELMHGAIAAALVQERNRCANLAFDDGKTYGGQNAEWLAGHMHARHAISKAIRGDHQ